MLTPVAASPAHPTLPFTDLHVPSVHVQRIGATGRTGWSPTTVAEGDTLFDLALRHGTSVEAIAERNGLRAADLLHPGQRLVVPAGGAAPRSATGAPSRDGGHVVRPGETVTSIAARHGVSVTALLSANGLTSESTIFPGKRLVVPEGRAIARDRATASRSRAVRASTVVATVREGDGIATLASRYGVSRAGILKANGLAAGTMLHPGQRLRIVGTTRGPGEVSDPGGDRVARAAQANRAYLDEHAADVTRGEVRDLVIDEAHRQGVDPSLALAVAWQESRWNARAVSDRNAVGPMQCLPSTARWIVAHTGRPLDVLDTSDNVRCGVTLLRGLHRAGDTEDEVIAAYYQGLGSVRANGMYEDTKAYVASVRRHQARM